MLVSSLNAASVDIVNDKVSPELSPKAQFTPLLYVLITLAADAEAESHHFTQPLQCYRHVETLSIQMASKQIIAWNSMVS